MPPRKVAMRQLAIAPAEAPPLYEAPRPRAVSTGPAGASPPRSTSADDPAGRAGLDNIYRYSDTLAALAAALLAFGVTWPGAATEAVDWGSFSTAAVIGLLVWFWPLLGSWSGLYATGGYPNPVYAAGRVARASAWGALLPLGYLATTGAPAIGVALVFWGAATSAALALRATIRWTAIGAAETLPRQVIIVGSGPRAVRLHRELSERRSPRFVPIGVVDDLDCGLASGTGLSMLGTPDQMEQVLMHRVVDEVLIALPIKSRYAEIQQVITACERTGVQSKYVADMFHCSVARPRYEDAEAGPVLNNRVFVDDYRLGLKRLVDVVVSAVAIVALAPLYVGIAIAIRVTSPGPVFFAQERFGLHKRRFRIFKFRTMVVDAEERQVELEDLNEASGPVFKMRDDPRVTRIGAFLRSSSLDELPQLWNVLRGDMSLVGPRPLPKRDVQRFDEPWLMRRFSVRPGVTCLWQIGGRNLLSFDDWVALDLQYIDRWSLLLDARILLQTVPAVLGRKGAM